MNWETVEDAGRAAIAWSLVADYAKSRYESARTFIADKLQNSRGIDVEVGGKVIGGVSRGQAKDEPAVTDDRAFIEFIVDNVPGVEMVRTHPYWKVTKDPEAKQQMYELLGRVTPTIEGFKALPEPEDKWTQDIKAGAIGGDQCVR